MFKFMPLALAALFALSACNTFEGVGQDVQEGGEAISESANEAQNAM
jgi:entericidin B